MAKTIDVFESTTGKKVKKVQNKAGNFQYFADGKPINSSSYGAYKSHTPSAEKFQRGNLENIEDTDSLGFPFNQRSFENIEAFEKGSEKRKRVQKKNAWVGYLASEDTPDDPFLAAEEYEKMVSELTRVESEERRQEIRRQYNVGGS